MASKWLKFATCGEKDRAWKPDGRECEGGGGDEMKREIQKLTSVNEEDGFMPTVETYQRNQHQETLTTKRPK